MIVDHHIEIKHLLLYQTGRVCTSQPAKKSGRSGRRKKIVIPMWCTHMCLCVFCSIVMLFTCTLVRSHPDSMEGIRGETRSIEINSKILDWTWQQDACLEREARRKLSLSLEWGHEGHIREVLQEDGCSSMYKSWLCGLTCIISVCSLSMPYNYLRPNWFTLLTTVIFRRLKINYDSHEFILETVVNNYTIFYAKPLLMIIV